MFPKLWLCRATHALENIQYCQNYRFVFIDKFPVMLCLYNEILKGNVNISTHHNCVFYFCQNILATILWSGYCLRHLRWGDSIDLLHL